MAFQPVPNVAHVTVEGVVDQQLTIIDLSFEISGGGITPVNLLGLCESVDGWASDSLAPQLSDDWSYVRTRARDLTSAAGAVAEFGTPTPGGVSGEALPNNVAACISLRTGFAGRSFRGRNYIPGVPSSLVTLNTMDSAFMANIVLVYDALVGPGTFLAGWQLGVVSRQTAGALRPSGIISPVVSVGFTTDKVRSMRSREIGHGA